MSEVSKRKSGSKGNGVRHLTLNDVAHESGFSVSTVSKAINGKFDVSASTKKRIFRIAEEMGFEANYYAKNLAKGTSETIGLLTDDLVGRFSIPILTGIENAFGSEKIAVFLCDARGDSIREAFHLRSLLSRRVDGIIVLASTSNPRKSLGTDLPVPIIYVYGHSEDPNDLSIITDDFKSAQLGIEHLVSLGRRRIAYITGDRSYDATQLRLNGIRAQLALNNLTLTGEPLFGDWSESWGRSGVDALIENGIQFDGIFCGNDQIARGSIERLRERGYSVPQQVSVLGFDNWDVVTIGCNPMITSIDLQLEELGGIAAQHLADMIAGKSIVGIKKYPGKLILREST
jgi:LacI family transcriptional regulator